jgi:hypothetical protein
MRLGFGLVLIWALFLPGISAGDHHLLLDFRPPLVLLALLALLGLMGLARRQLWASLRWLFAALLLILAGLQFADAAVERLLDRPFDAYFDLRHVPNLLGLYLNAAGPGRGGLVIAGAAIALVVIFVLLAYAIASIELAAKRPQVALASILASIAGFALFAVPPSLGGSWVNASAATAAWQQASAAGRAFAVIHGLDKRYDTALTTPQPALGPLPGLKGRDVYLVFIESYGSVVLDDPIYHAALAPALQGFATTAGDAGYHLVSSRLVSPTYGGGSWLAHGSIASGLKLDSLLAELIVNSDRKSLPRYLSAAGYRTVEIMPGIKKPNPEAAFWGFDAHYYARELAYAGPEFGWFDIPDQYTLAQFSARELGPAHGPLFAQLVLVSSHTPFAPVPPYLDDWRDVGAYDTIKRDEWARIYAPPDWNNLDRPYLDSIAYDLKVLGSWLAGLDKDALVIILGDHQPPDLTRGADKAWTVPIHVLSRDPDLVRPFENSGYVAGDEPPPRDDAEGMEKFLAEFLTDFAPSVATTASAPQQSPDAPAVFQP